MSIPSFFHHVSINVSNYDRELAFYSALGFSLYVEWIEKGKRHCLIDMENGPFFELRETDTPPETDRMHHICIHTEDVDGFYNQATVLGAAGVMEPVSSALHCADCVIEARVAFVKAPGGEELEILHWKHYERDQYKDYKVGK